MDWLKKIMQGVGSVPGAEPLSNLNQLFQPPSSPVQDKFQPVGQTKSQGDKGVFSSPLPQSAPKPPQIAETPIFTAFPREQIKGLLMPGNVDLSKQPVVKNQDGSTSTVHSVSWNVAGKEVLLPRVTPDGRHLSDQEALEEFYKTGKHLGVFDSPESATAYAQALHGAYEQGKIRGYGNN